MNDENAPTVPPNHVNHPDNEHYTLSVTDAAALMGCCNPHARNQMRAGRLEHRKLIDHNGIEKYFTTEQHVREYLNGRQQRGRKPGSGRPPNRVYKISLSSDQMIEVNAFLQVRNLPELVPARNLD